MTSHRFSVVATPDDGSRLSAHQLWDEAERPTGPSLDPDRRYAPRDLASGRHLVDIHDHLRTELSEIRELVTQVLDGTGDPGRARSEISEMTIRQNNWTMGAYCAAYCRVLTTHHSIEDQAMFPQLRGADPRLGPVLDRLALEHTVIHGVLEDLDRAPGPGRFRQSKPRAGCPQLSPGRAVRHLAVAPVLRGARAGRAARPSRHPRLDD